MTEYDSYSNYESSVLKAEAAQSSFSIGISIPSLFEIGYSNNDNRFRKFIQRMKRFSSTVSLALLQSFLTHFLYLCVYWFHSHRQVGSRDCHKWSLSLWLDFAVFIGQMFTKAATPWFVFATPGSFSIHRSARIQAAYPLVSHSCMQSVQSLLGIHIWVFVVKSQWK